MYYYTTTVTIIIVIHHDLMRPCTGAPDHGNSKHAAPMLVKAVAPHPASVSKQGPIQGFQKGLGFRGLGSFIVTRLEGPYLAGRGLRSDFFCY